MALKLATNTLELVCDMVRGAQGIEEILDSFLVSSPYSATKFQAYETDVDTYLYGSKRQNKEPEFEDLNHVSISYKELSAGKMEFQQLQKILIFHLTDSQMPWEVTINRRHQPEYFMVFSPKIPGASGSQGPRGRKTIYI